MTAQQEWTDWSCAVVVRAVSAPDLDPAVRIVRAVMDEVSASANRFRADSDLSRVNAAAGRLVPVSDLTTALVATALDAAAETSGAIDPTVGRALLELGYDADIDVVRSRRSPSAVTRGARGCWGDVRVDTDLGLVGVPAGAVLDLGALAKAWAVDEAVARVAAAASGPVLVSIGGDLAVHGAPDGGWDIGVAETRGGPTEMVCVDSGALATSSTLVRRWAGGHHIVDPRTGSCADGPYRTATVWAPTAVEANLLSTWALVDALPTLFALSGREALARLVRRDGGVERVGGWPGEEQELAS